MWTHFVCRAPARSDSRSCGGRNAVLCSLSSPNPSITTDTRENSCILCTVQHTHTNLLPMRYIDNPGNHSNTQTNHKNFTLSAAKGALATCLLAIVNRSFSLSLVSICLSPFSSSHDLSSSLSLSLFPSLPLPLSLFPWSPQFNNLKCCQRRHWKMASIKHNGLNQSVPRILPRCRWFPRHPPSLSPQSPPLMN